MYILKYIYIVLLIINFCISVEMTSEKESPSRDYPSYDCENPPWEQNDDEAAAWHTACLEKSKLTITYTENKSVLNRNV